MSKFSPKEKNPPAKPPEEGGLEAPDEGNAAGGHQFSFRTRN